MNYLFLSAAGVVVLIIPALIFFNSNNPFED